MIFGIRCLIIICNYIYRNSYDANVHVHFICLLHASRHHLYHSCVSSPGVNTYYTPQTINHGWLDSWRAAERRWRNPMVQGGHVFPNREPFHLRLPPLTSPGGRGVDHVSPDLSKASSGKHCKWIVWCGIDTLLWTEHSI